MCCTAALRVADALGFLLADHAGSRFADLGEDFLRVGNAGSTTGKEIGCSGTAVMSGVGGGT